MTAATTAGCVRDAGSAGATSDDASDREMSVRRPIAGQESSDVQGRHSLPGQVPSRFRCREHPYEAVTFKGTGCRVCMGEKAAEPATSHERTLLRRRQRVEAESRGW